MKKPSCSQYLYINCNKPKIEEPGNFYEKYFNGFNIITAKHDRKRKSTKILDTKVLYKGLEWPVEKIEYGVCEECKHPVFALDTYRGETVCERCGYVKNSIHLTDDRELLIQHGIIVDEGTESTAHNKPNNLSKSGKYIQKLNKHDRLCWVDNKKKVWRKSQYAIFVDIVSSNYMMTSYQKQRAKEVIDKFSLSQIHSRINHNAIITGICIYFMKKDGRHVLIKNNSFCKEVGLNNNSYKVIKKNMDSLLS
jgi:uncharacterized Zn finger protein (UPF0148 family)